MNVVGRVGSLISQGVYSVATPFHPFGGAVDIIVVEQEDGTYRSTPWYVRFGKFQGIIKGAEKVVTIAVNDLEANFHMYLDSSGQAYFMQEIMTGSNDEESNEPVLNESSGMGDGEDHLETGQGEKIEEHNSDPHDMFDENGEYAGADVQLNGSKDEQSAVGNTSMSNTFKKYHYGNLEEVEDVVKSSNDANSEMVLVSVDGHVLTVPISANETAAENLQLDTPQFHLGPGEGPGEEFGSGGVIWEDGLYVDLEGCTSKEEGGLGNPSEYVPNDAKRVSFQMEQVQSVGIHEAINNSDNAIASFTKEDTFKSCLDLTSNDMNFHDMSIVAEDSLPKASFELSLSSSSVDNVIVSEASVRDDGNVVISENVELKSPENNISANSKLSDNLIGVNVAMSDMPFNELSMKNNMVEEVPKNSLAAIDMSQICSTDISINDAQGQAIEKQDAAPTEAKSNQIEDQGSQSSISSLGFEISLCGNLLSHGMGRIAAEEVFNTHRVHEDVFKVSGPSIISSDNLIVRYKGMYFTWDKAVTIVLGKAVYGSGFSCDIKDSIPIDPKEISSIEDVQIASSSSSSSSRRWRLWPIPFRRSRTLQHSNSDSSNEDLFVDTDPGSQAPYVEQDLGTDSNRSPRKQHFRTYIPSMEQIASLKLKDGQNMVAFSFSTRVLGKQQVDAHIYLWKWNTRIVISDVDGTITKSDVLGQFMPLVGKDWTQSGVARLFSAIKENGYQLLFLSARAIVQAYLTRSFLLNLKQDGKALPSGPVVISPDGLFPSLYREVIRRAPHEFKIACLEDIRALFPSDYNPFYAGFGNRDTDELSYRKIGIPKGKIFIINPKGEVAINHCIDVKSYTSLHTLVNDMFPPTSLVEQEDFNSWNYWKMPLPSIDC